jgi:hypothetical protein
MADDALTALKVEIGKFGVELANVAHDVKNVVLRLESFVTRREAEAIKTELTEKITAQEKQTAQLLAALDRATDHRITPLEQLVRWGGRIVVGAVLLALLGLVMTGRAKVGLP